MYTHAQHARIRLARISATFFRASQIEGRLIKLTVYVHPRWREKEGWYKRQIRPRVREEEEIERYK